MSGIQKTLVFKNVLFLELGKCLIREVGKEAGEMRREKILNRNEVTESLEIPEFFAKETRVAELKIANAALKLSETGLLKCDTTRKCHFSKTLIFRWSHMSKKCTF